MSLAAAAELSREIADAGRSLVRLARFDPLWHEGLDISRGGLVRSFFAPLFSLPFHMVFAILATTGGGASPIPLKAVLAIGLAQVLNVFGFPALVSLVARPLGFSAGYGPFIIVTNWASLFFSMALCLIAPLTLLGRQGADLMSFVALMAFALRVFVTWRAARNTLADDIAPALLMIVMLVAVDYGADQMAALLARAID